MSSRFLGFRCRAEGLEQFRTTRPPRPPPNGPVHGRNWWKKVPSNGVAKRRWKDEEIRKAMRPPSIDPFDRLEFIRPEDLDEPGKGPPESTAMPVEERNLIKATKVRKEILRRLERVQRAQLQKQIDEGEITQDDIDEMEDELRRAQEDPLIMEEMDRTLHPEEENEMYAEYPDEDGVSVDRSAMSFIDQLMLDYHVPGYVEFGKLDTESDTTIPVVRLSHCNGEEVVISLHGGCLLSWVGQDGKERLFQNPEETFDQRRPVRSSGMTLAFPQYGKRGVMPEDGFVNRLLWNVVRSEVGIEWLPDPAPSVTLFCRDNEETRKIWPHRFEIYFKITLSETDEFGPLEEPIKEQRRFMKRATEIGTLKGVMEELLEAEEGEEDEPFQMEQRENDSRRQMRTTEFKQENVGDKKTEEDDAADETAESIPTQLKLQFTVRNTGDKPMAFMLACRTHFKTLGMFDFGEFVRILGLGGRRYIDYNIVPGRPILRVWKEDYLILNKRKEGWNAIFTENVLNDVFFCAGRAEYYETITRKGFPDVLLGQSSLHGIQPLDMSHQMTMVGRGRVTVPAKLEPGEKWEGEYILRHHDHYFEEPIFGYQSQPPPADMDKIRAPVEDTSLTSVDRRS